MDSEALARLRRYAACDDKGGWLNVKPSDVAALLAERDSLRDGLADYAHTIANQEDHIAALLAERASVAAVLAAAEAWATSSGFAHRVKTDELYTAVATWRATRGEMG